MSHAATPAPIETEYLLTVPVSLWNDIRHTFSPAPLHIRVSFRFHATSAPPGLVEMLKMPYGEPCQWDSAT